MGGVDLMDGLMVRYHIKVKTRNAMVRLFYHFIDMAATNAYIVYRWAEVENRNDSSFVSPGGKKEKVLQMAQFREKIVISLILYTCLIFNN